MKYEGKCERVIVLDACYTIRRPRTKCLAKTKTKTKTHLFHILLQLSFALVVWLTTPVIKSIAFSFFKSSLEDSGQQSNK